MAKFIKPSIHPLHKTPATLVINPSQIYVAKNYGYINGILKGDLAILKLDRSVAYTDRIQPACLPDKNDQFKNYEPLVVTG